MKWVPSNIERITKNFRKAEKYIGDMNKKVDITTDDYKRSLALLLDLGMYDDEYSNQFPLTQQENFVAVLMEKHNQIMLLKYQPTLVT